MQWWEVLRAVQGIRRRYRPIWETTRWLGWIISRILGGKIDDPQSFMQFPWEIECVDTEALIEANEKLLEECRAENLAKLQQKEVATQ